MVGSDGLTIAERVHAILRARILSGVLPAGVRLRQEAISDELRVSRTPVREALARLLDDGLAEHAPGQGFAVSDLAPEELLAAHEARLAIEPIAARLAAARAGEPDLAGLRATLAAFRAAGGEAAPAFDAGRAFHLALVRASGNDVLLRFAEHLWSGRLSARVYEEQQADASLLAEAARDHAAIVSAIASGDADAAEHVTRTHVEASVDRLRGRLAAVRDDGRADAFPGAF